VCFFDLTFQIHGVVWDLHWLSRQNGIDGSAAAFQVLIQHPIDGIADDGCDRLLAALSLVRELLITVFLQQDLQAVRQHAHTLTHTLVLAD